MDNLRYVDNVDGVEMDLLQRILPHCKMEDLTRIENNTEMDLTPVTDKLWKLFYTRQFGEENANQVVKRMSMSGARYKWKDLFDAKTKKQKEYEEKMGQRLAKKYEAAKAGKVVIVLYRKCAKWIDMCHADNRIAVGSLIA